MTQAARGSACAIILIAAGMSLYHHVMTRNGWIAVMLASTAAVLWLVMIVSVRDDRPHRTGAPPDARSQHLEPAQELDPEPQPTAAELPEPAANPTAEPAPVAQPAVKTAIPDVADLPPPEKSGPVDELKERFAREPRESSVGGVEKQIEAAFRSDEIPPGLLKSVLCRSTVCRVELEWTPARGIAFMAAFTRLLMVPPDSPEPPKVFDSNLGISPEGDPDENGARSVDVYIARLPQAEPAP